MCDAANFAGQLIFPSTQIQFIDIEALIGRVQQNVVTMKMLTCLIPKIDLLLLAGSRSQRLRYGSGEGAMMPIENSQFGAVESSDDQIWDLLSLYADGEASDEEKKIVEALLTSNATYRSRLNFIQSASTVLSVMDEIEPPAMLRSAILDSTCRRRTMWSRAASAVVSIREAFAPSFNLRNFGLVGACVIAAVVIHSSRFPHVKSGDNTHGTSAIAVHPPFTAAETDSRANVNSSEGNRLPQLAEGGPVVRSRIPEGIRIALQPGNRRSSDTVRAVSQVNSKPHHEVVPVRSVDEPGNAVVSDAVYRPDMDAQNERPTASVPMPAADSDGPEITVSGASEKDVAANPSKVEHQGSDTAVLGSMNSNEDGRSQVHVIVAHLHASALPPEPTQVLTRADMARNRDAQNYGYDRSTLRSLERKEASISLFRGSF